MNSTLGNRSQDNRQASHGFSLFSTGNDRTTSSTGWRDQPTFPLTSQGSHQTQPLVAPRTTTPWWEPAQAATASPWRNDTRLTSSTQSSAQFGSSWTGSSFWGNGSTGGGNGNAGGNDFRSGFGQSFNGGKTDARKSSPLWSQNWRQVWPEVSARVTERTSRTAEPRSDTQSGSKASSTATSQADRTSPLWTSLITGRTPTTTTLTPAKPAPKSITPAPAPKPVAPKPVAPKPVEIKPVETKPVAPKPVETKPVEPKPVETKPVAPKPVEIKPVEPKPVETPPPVTPGPVQTTPPVELTPPVVAPQPPALSAQQRADLTEIHRIATSGRVTPAEQQTANAIYGRFRLDNATIAELQDTARTVASQLLTPANAEFAKASREWGSYGPQQRQEVLAKFVGTLNDTLGLDVEARFFNTPPVDGRITHGFYSTGTNSLNLNTNPASIDSFAFAVKTAFHEMIHAQYFDKTKGLTPDTALAKVNSGEIDFTTAMVYFNALPGLYLTTPQVTRTEYMLNPHEQLAFTGQYFWEKEAAAIGLTDSSPTFTGANPLFEHLRNNRFA